MRLKTLIFIYIRPVNKTPRLLIIQRWFFGKFKGFCFAIQVNWLNLMLKKLLTNKWFLFTAIGVVGFESHRRTMQGLDERTSQQLMALKLEQQSNGNSNKGTESTKVALKKMLDELPTKTTRMKLEDAVDAAHKTHGLGFRNSPFDPVDVGLPTSYKTFSDGTDVEFKHDED